MGAYLSEKVRFSSQATMGRFLRSLKVGRMTEYLSPEEAVLVGAMVDGMKEKRSRMRLGGSNRGRM